MKSSAYLEFAIIFVAGTYMETCEVDTTDGHVLASVKNVGLYAHLAWLLCNLCLQCCNHICSVTYVKYVYSDTGVET